MMVSENLYDSNGLSHKNIELIIKQIINCAYLVHKSLSSGFLESVYQRSLVIELKEAGLKVETEVPLTVFYRNQVVGEFRADIVVENEIIIELKAVQELSVSHEVQLVNYLNATGKETGLLINFGAYPIQIKRKFRDHKSFSIV